jgi:hypothetical protein
MELAQYYWRESYDSLSWQQSYPIVRIAYVGLAILNLVKFAYILFVKAVVLPLFKGRQIF